MFDLNTFLMLLAIFLAVFTQSLSGFGVAVIAMALLPGLVGIQVATPLVALVAISIEAVLFVYYREALNIRAIWPIALASIIGIPIGVWALKGVDEASLLFILGTVVSSYALYALLRFKLPEMHHPAWSWGIGFIAGILGGAYNVSGPPVIIYSDIKRWPPAEFKSNIQGFFVVASSFVLVSHILSGNITPIVWRYYLWSIPAMVLGILIGISLDRHLNPLRFRKIVLVLLVIMGLRLIYLALL